MALAVYATMNSLEVLSITAASYALLYVLIIVGARTLSAEYLLKFGVFIDSPGRYTLVIRALLVFLIFVLLPSNVTLLVFTGAALVTLLINVVLDRLWLVSWVSYGLQIFLFTLPLVELPKVILGLLGVAICLASDLISNTPNERRFDRYIIHTNRRYRMKYSHLTGDILTKRQQDCLYTLMLIENMNRPWGFRFIEWFYMIIFPKKAISNGIMQVTSTLRLTNEESIVHASKMIVVADGLLQLKGYRNPKKRLEKVAYYYNGSESYVNLYFRDIYDLVS